MSDKLLSRNDQCTCGANRKYKKCCARVEDERRLGSKRYEHFSIKDIVIEEIRSFREIFGVHLTHDKLQVSGNIVDSDVLLFVERVRNLWGSKRDLLPLMPAKSDYSFRALYHGDPDILSTVNLLTRYSLYCDQIIVIDPLSFFFRVSRTSEHSPFREPQAWVRQIIRNGVYLASLEEWIKNDLVFATAFPLSFADPLKQNHIQQMRQRAAKMPDDAWEELTRDMIKGKFYPAFTPVELSAMQPKKSDVEMIRLLAEDDGLWNRVKNDMKGITREKVIETLRSMEQQTEDIEKAIARLQQEPRRYEWALQRQFESRMDIFGSGMNLMDAEWFAEITGSHLVTDRRALWNDILAGEQNDAPVKKPSDKLKRSMSELAEAFQKLEFYFLNDVPLDFALQIRKESRLTGFRTYLREFWNRIRRENESEDHRLATIQEFRDGLDAQYEQFKREFAEIRKTVLSKIAVAGVSGAGAILSGQISLGIFSLGAFVAAYTDEAKRQTKRSQALSVFLDLERR